MEREVDECDESVDGDKYDDDGVDWVIVAMGSRRWTAVNAWVFDDARRRTTPLAAAVGVKFLMAVRCASSLQ